MVFSGFNLLVRTLAQEVFLFDVIYTLKVFELANCKSIATALMSAAFKSSAFFFSKRFSGVMTITMPSFPYSKAINKAIQNESVFPKPVAAMPITSLLRWRANTIFIWYQHAHLLNFLITKSLISFIDHSLASEVGPIKEII